MIDAGGRIGRNFSPERQLEGVNLFGTLADHIRARMADGPVVVASYSQGARERLEGLLVDQDLTGGRRVGHASDVSAGLNLAVWPLEAGFQTSDLTVISEQDVLGDRLIRAPKRKRRAENFLTEAQSLSPVIWWFTSTTVSGGLAGSR